MVVLIAVIEQTELFKKGERKRKSFFIEAITLYHGEPIFSTYRSHDLLGAVMNDKTNHSFTYLDTALENTYFLKASVTLYIKAG